jgi:type II secretory pathway pseudopilin PulG
MQTRTGTGRGSGAGGAFTLVELLLSITLLLLLISALVFNFAGMRRGAGLQEGETQVEALLRFARGYAATSGRLVQIRLTNEVTEGTNLVFSMVSEIDSIHNPGYFEPVFEAAPYLDQIATLVNVTGLRLVDEAQPVVDLAATNTVDQAVSSPELSPPISFFPDGSSDSAEIRIMSKDEDDMRRIAITLRGEIGGVTYRYVSDDLEADELMDALPEGLP